jgi:hypothetical protein
MLQNDYAVPIKLDIYIKQREDSGADTAYSPVAEAAEARGKRGNPVGVREARDRAACLSGQELTGRCGVPGSGEGRQPAASDAVQENEGRVPE